MQSGDFAFLAGPVGVGFPAGAGGGPVATEALSRVSGSTPDGRPSARGGMGPDVVAGSHETSAILPVAVEGGCEREGFIEFLAPGARAPLDAAILSGTAWLDALHGHAPLRKQLPEGTAELGAAVGLAPRMTTGKVSRTRSKAARMSRTGGAVTSSAAVGFETGSQTARG